MLRACGNDRSGLTRRQSRSRLRGSYEEVGGNIFFLFLHLCTPRLCDDLPHSIAMTTVRLFPLAPSPTSPMSTRDWPTAVANDSTCSPRSERRLARATSLRSVRGAWWGGVCESGVWRQPSTFHSLCFLHRGAQSLADLGTRDSAGIYVIVNRSQSHRNCRTLRV